MATEIPSYLRARVKAARERAQLAVQPSRMQVSQPGQPTTQHIASATTPKAVLNVLSKQMSKVGAIDRKSGQREERDQHDGREHDAKMADLLVARSSDREMAELVRQHLPGVYEAIIVGAKRPGRDGSNDRQTLFKMLGLPGHGSAGRSNAPSDGGLDRLTRALSRLERRLSGNEAVIVDADVIEDRPSMLTGPHVMSDPLPEPPAGKVDDGG